MAHDVRSKLNSQILEEAAEWLVEFRSGDVTLAGREAFDAWVRTSPEHLRAFIEMAALWSDATCVDPQREIDIDKVLAGLSTESNVIALDRAAQRTANRMDIPDGAREAIIVANARRLRVRRPLIAAALIGALMGMALMSWSIFRVPPVYDTGVGEQRLISLADGSMVTLNARSRLRVAFTADRRTVELLEGQAFFHVAKNATRPFIVLSNDTVVRAVGTQFDVSMRNGGTTVTVLEGRVAVYPERMDDKYREADVRASSRSGRPTSEDGAGSVLLTADERVQVVDGGMPVQPVHVDASSATAWREGRVLLDSATLSEVAAEFNRYSVRQITAEDHGASPLRLSGIFTTDSEFLIHYLRERPDVTVSETDTTVHIVREAEQ